MHLHRRTNRALEIKNVELWIKKGKDFPSLALRCSLPLLAGQLKQNKPLYFPKNTNTSGQGRLVMTFELVIALVTCIATITDTVITLLSFLKKKEKE